MADTVEKNLTDAAVAVAKTEAAALKAAEAAFAQASDAAIAPIKAMANAAPAPAKAATTKAAPAKTAARKAATKTAKAATAKAGARKAAKKSPARKPAKQAAAAKRAPAITKAPARAAAKTIKTGAKTMNTQTKKAAQTAQIASDQFKTVIGDVNARAQTAMEKNAKIVEELAELTRGNVDAFVTSSKVAAKAVETMSQNAANFSRKSFENATSAFKSFSEVKSATDFFKLQGDFARSSFDSAVAESARVSETMLKLAGDVAEPLTSRYTVAADRVKTLAA